MRSTVRSLPLLQHILSSYRKCANRENTKLNPLRLGKRGTREPSASRVVPFRGLAKNHAAAPDGHCSGSRLAESLSSRLGGSNVAVVSGDAVLGRSVSGSVSFTMLHPAPSTELQNKVLREVWRVLEPGGVFVGSSSLQGLFMRRIHIGDTLGGEPGYFWPRARGRRIRACGIGKEF